MDEQTFWNLIEETRADGIEQHAERLADAVAALGPDEATGFTNLWDEKHVAAYRWDLWAAAYEINGGCSDDCFSDFRSYLISLGRAVYEAALADPDSLADVDVVTADADWEDIAYVGQLVFERLDIEEPPRGTFEPDDPVGHEWDEEAGESAKVVPRLAAKYGGG